MSSFRAFPSITVNGTTFRLYESNKTGLRGLLMETGEPLCNIQCVIATESDTHDWTHKDDGLPHTLEHAIFMGSELFPYKGILDKLANRCLASGTNAWTATDHTCYTMESAGHEGCLNLLPIYADHILHPTLTDACFHTEVHHVTGEGEDKGVVYCEMQARENGSGSLVDRAILSLLYPQGGYSSETGGKMANLHTLTNAQVARYHQELYRPDNMCFIVSGTAGEAEFLRALEQVEERVRSKGYARGAKPRPWELPVAPMAAAGGTEGIFGPGGAPPGSPKVVPFPSKDESSGVVSMGWRGPNYDDQATWTQLKLLWQYLTNGAASPLTKGMVEVAEPLCTSVGPADEIFSSGYHQVWFQNAKCETIDRVPAEFYTQLNEALASFDLARMHSVIRLRRRKHLESLERAPTSAMSRHVIEHFLYATRGGADGAGDAAEMASLVKGVDMLPHLEAAEAMATEGWVALATEWILTREVAVVVGKPSATLADEIPAAVTKRQEATKAELGEAGLLQMAELLEKATAQNETPIPTKYLTAVPIPSKASVRSIPLVSIRGSSALQVAPSSGEGIPPAETSRILEALGASCAGLPEGQRACLASYWQEFAHIHSQFVSIAVAVDTSHLTNEQRLHLPLLELMAFKLPCDLDDGTHLSKEEFVTALQGDTVKYNCSTGGVAGGSPQMLTFFIQVELDKGAGLSLGLEWIRRALYLTTFTAESLKTTVEQCLGRIPAAKRNGHGVASALLGSLVRDPDQSNTLVEHAIRQYPFLTRLSAQLATDEGSAAVLAAMGGLRTALLQPSRMNLFIAGDLTQLPDPYPALAAAIVPPAKTMSKTPPTGPFTGVSEKLLATGRTGQVVLCALSAVETHYVTVSAPGLGAYSPDHAALLVAIEYITALEGDFWVKLRGPGLTYSYSIRALLDAQLVQFGLFKCTDMLSAYSAAKSIIEGYASGRESFSEIMLDGAKSTVTYTLVRGTSTRLSAAATAFDNQYGGKGVDYSKWLLEQLDHVTAADALHALKKYIVPLFDASANVAATCPVNKIDADADGLREQLGVPVRKLLEENLFTAFDPVPEAAEEVASAQVVASAPAKKVKRGGAAAFSFAKNYKCECPKCEQPEELKM